jgi:hypothetical protein
MGNWGNTLDRWYHRAAVVVWPREQAFANRAETSPAWALDELTAMASADGPVRARATAATLAPFWDGALRAQADAEGSTALQLFGKALQTARAMADAQTATMLLRPFRIENLADPDVSSFGTIAEAYGEQWTAHLLRAWFGRNEPAWTYGGSQERLQWVSDRLPGLCERLHTRGGAGAVAAQGILDLAWEWLGKDIRSGLELSTPSYRDSRLGDLGKPLAAVLMAATAAKAASTREAVCRHICKQDDAVTALEMSALRAAAEMPGNFTRGGDGFAGLAADCAARLRARLTRPQRTAGDWSIRLRAGGCTCELCGTLRAFLQDKGQRTFEWRLAKQRRQHIHSRIDAAELPVTHVTRRQGSPYTLVLHKTDALFAREQEARAKDEKDLQWLTAQRSPGA